MTSRWPEYRADLAFPEEEAAMEAGVRELHLTGIGQPLDEVPALGVDVRGGGDDQHLRLPGRGHVHLRPAGPDGLLQSGVAVICG